MIERLSFPVSREISKSAARPLRPVLDGFSRAIARGSPNGAPLPLMHLARMPEICGFPQTAASS